MSKHRQENSFLPVLTNRSIFFPFLPTSVDVLATKHTSKLRFKYSSIKIVNCTWNHVRDNLWHHQEVHHFMNCLGYHEIDTYCQMKQLMNQNAKMIPLDCQTQDCAKHIQFCYWICKQIYIDVRMMLKMFILRQCWS